MTARMEKVVRVFDTFEEADARFRVQMSHQQRADIFFALRERAHANAINEGFARVYRVLELEQS